MLEKDTESIPKTSKSKKKLKFDLQSWTTKTDYWPITQTKGNKKKLRFATPSPLSKDQQSDQKHLPAKKEKYQTEQHRMNGLDH